MGMGDRPVTSATVVDLFSTPYTVLAALLVAGFSPNFLVGEPPAFAKEKSRKGARHSPSAPAPCARFPCVAESASLELTV